jgi:hypothetical protein
MSTRLGVILLALAVPVAAAAGYSLGSDEDGVDAARRCPPSAWKRGGGTDYVIAGMSCAEANRFVLHGFARGGPLRVGRALAFRDWVCFQRQTGGRYSPVRNVCADGRRRVTFLMH